jgi:L-seryl-tRNA(Ser) seleniumtransferase
MRPTADQLRDLPSMDRLLAHSKSEALLARFGRRYVTERCREVLDDLRTAIREGIVPPAPELEEASILRRVENRIASERELALTRVVNATGTVLHTNLGRALLPPAAIEAITLAGRHPMTLEYDLLRGERGKRETTIEALLVDLTGAEAATVVNNNAAAVLLVLNTLASGKEVIVSRGELVEIGGAFRIPEIMAKSGSVLTEVGTTNRTHLHDYERAISDKTGLLLKVHTSNYKVVGFASAVSAADLAALGRTHNVPVMEDLGSGALVDLSRYGLPKEPLVAEQVSRGVDIVTFSGDKVLGGPQAGLIVGRKRLIDRIAENPLHRALRCGKLTLAALEATLRIYQQSPCVTEEIPTLQALTRPIGALVSIGNLVLPLLERALGSGFRVSLEDGTSQVGSGALAVEEIPTKVVAIQHETIGADRIAERFRSARPPVIGRIRDGRFLLDLRTIFDPEDLIPKWTEGS